MSDDMKHITLAYMYVKLYSWPLKFRKVVRQQIWWEVIIYFLLFRRFFMNLTVKNLWKLVHVCQSYHKNKSGTYFFETRGTLITNTSHDVINV